MQFCLRDLRSLSQGDFETWHAEDGMPRPRSLSAVVFLDQNVSWLNPVGATWKFVELLPSKCEAEYTGALMVIPGSHKSFLRCPGRQKGANWEKSLQSQAWRTTCSVDSFRHFQTCPIPEVYGTPAEEHLRQLAESNGIKYCTGAPGDAQS